MGAQGFSEVIVWGNASLMCSHTQVPSEVDVMSAYKVLYAEALRRTTQDPDCDPGPEYNGTITTTSLRKVFSTPLSLDDAYDFLKDRDAKGQGVEKYECDAVALADGDGNRAGWVFSGIAAT